MSIRTATSGTKIGPMFAVVLGVLMCVVARAAPAIGVDSTDALPTGAALYGQVRALAARDRLLAGSAPGFSAAADASLSDLMVRLHYAFGSDPRLSSNRAQPDEREILLKNSDAFVRTKVRLTVGKEWHGFLYADMGASDSALKWQSVAGIRAGHGVDLLGGWRHVTYHFSPGMGFDSLDFNGPFFGATLAW
jgi:hypothetical protein